MSTYILLGEVSKNKLASIRKEDLFKTVKLLLSIIETDENGKYFIDHTSETDEIVAEAINLVN